MCVARLLFCKKEEVVGEVNFCSIEHPRGHYSIQTLKFWWDCNLTPEEIP